MLSSEPQTPRLPGLLWGSSSGPAASGIWCLVSIAASFFPSQHLHGVCRRAGLLWAHGTCLVAALLLSPLALWDVAAGPYCCQGDGVNRSTRTWLQEAPGSWRDLPTASWAGATVPALHSCREALGNPVGWLKECARVLGFVCLFGGFCLFGAFCCVVVLFFFFLSICLTPTCFL